MTDSLGRETAGTVTPPEAKDGGEQMADEFLNLRKDLYTRVQDWLKQKRFKRPPFYMTPDRHFQSQNLLFQSAKAAEVRDFNKLAYYNFVMVHLLIDHVFTTIEGQEQLSENDLIGHLRAASPCDLDDLAHPAYEMVNGLQGLKVWTPRDVNDYIKGRLENEKDPQRRHILKAMGMEMQRLLSELGWEIDEEHWPLPSPRT